MNQFEILSIEMLTEEYEVLNESDVASGGFLSWITNSGLWNWFKGKIIGHDELGKAFANPENAKKSLDWYDKYINARKTIHSLPTTDPEKLKAIKLADGTTLKDVYDKAMNFLGIKGHPFKQAEVNGTMYDKANSLWRTMRGEPRILKVDSAISEKAGNISGGLVSWLPEEVQQYLREHGNITTGVAAAAGILGLIYLYRKFIRNPNKKLDRQTALYAQKLNNINPNQLSQSQLNNKIL